MPPKNIVYPLSRLLPRANWTYFFNAWGLPPRFAAAGVHDCPACRESWVRSFPPAEHDEAREALRLFDEARRMLRRLEVSHRGYARFGLFDAWSEGDDIVIDDGRQQHRLPMLRQQRTQRPGDPFLCNADFIRPREKHIKGDIASTVGLFCATFRPAGGKPAEAEQEDDKLLYQTVCDRLAEATAEVLNDEIRDTYWQHPCIRPAVGYPSIPDQTIIFLLDRILDYGKIGITLTESGMMQPHASVSGMLFAHPAATYFSVGRIGEEQLADYARRRRLPAETLRKYLRRNLE